MIQTSGNGLGVFYFFCLGAATGIIIYLIMELIENK